MKDAQELVEHVPYPEGIPNMQRLNHVIVGEDVGELYQAGLAGELAAVDNLRRAIAHCASVGDFTTRAKLEEMIADEEQHVDLFETQLSAIERVGIERYLAQQVRGGGSDSARARL